MSSPWDAHSSWPGSLSSNRRRLRKNLGKGCWRFAYRDKDQALRGATAKSTCTYGKLVALVESTGDGRRKKKKKKKKKIVQVNNWLPLALAEAVDHFGAATQPVKAVEHLFLFLLAGQLLFPLGAPLLRIRTSSQRRWAGIMLRTSADAINVHTYGLTRDRYGQ